MSVSAVIYLTDIVRSTALNLSHVCNAGSVYAGANPTETVSVHFDPRIVFVPRCSPEIKPRGTERFVPLFLCNSGYHWFAVEISILNALAMYSVT